MNKTTNSSAVKTCASLSSGKNEKKGISKETIIKEKVAKNDIFDLVNGLSSESSLSTSNFAKKPVENGKHIYTESNKLSRDVDVLKHTVEGIGITESASSNKSKTKSKVNPNGPSVCVNNSREPVNRQKSKKSKLKNCNANDTVAQVTQVNKGPQTETLQTLVDSENVTSQKKPNDDSCSTQTEDLCIGDSACNSGTSSMKCADGSESVKDEVVDKLKNLSLDPSTREGDTECAEGPVIKELPPVHYVQYENELQMPMIMKIIQKDLSEPYSIYTYRYFIHNWPKLCFLAMCEGNCVGAIVCKLDLYRKVIRRGYIAMLAVDQNYRKRGIGSTLVRRAIQEMILGEADEVVLETEITNKPALKLYEALGFVRDKRLFRYYLNGVDALRLKLWLR